MQGATPAALDRFYEMIYQPPVKVAILGPIFSAVSEVVAEVMSRWTIVGVCMDSLVCHCSTIYSFTLVLYIGRIFKLFMRVREYLFLNE